MLANTPDLFAYLNYRKFLLDWLKSAKQHYGFSYRVFSQRAGFRSRSLFKQVLDGKKSLVDGSLNKFMDGLHLEGVQREYFRSLVLFNHADDKEEKKRLSQKLTGLRGLRGQTRVLAPMESYSVEIPAEKLPEAMKILEKTQREIFALAEVEKKAAEPLLLAVHFSVKRP